MHSAMFTLQLNLHAIGYVYIAVEFTCIVCQN